MRPGRKIVGNILNSIPNGIKPRGVVPVIDITSKNLLTRFDSVAKTINTDQGVGYYIGTSVEEDNQRWSDDYTVKDGFYVLHQGKHHHIYKVN